MKPGKLFIISGPSQVGKDSVVRSLWKNSSLNLVHIITYTTRNKRPGEKNGQAYNFVPPSIFEKMITQEKFLEWATVRQAYFGTPKQPVEQALKKGKNVILQIDVQGAAQIKNKLPETILIFITAESKQEIKRRIFASTKMTAEQKNSRWLEAQQELKKKPMYQYTIINRLGYLNKTVRQVKNIILNHTS
ncbi:guanylate kinase [Patescibacteria group bacterium]|nr:guanylate kinase [Patescibacteria group bacterium]